MSQMVSVVIPVYNNAQTLEETCIQTLKTQAENFSELSLKILFVNDGSKDTSWEKLFF